MTPESFEQQFLREIKQPVFWVKVFIGFIVTMIVVFMGMAL
jgi:hypothetical protein